MKKFISNLAIFTLVTIFAVTANGQNLFVSPTSIPAWGKAPSTLKASVEYADFELIYLTYSGNEHWEDKQGNDYAGTFVGLFYTPVNYDTKHFNIDAGAGFFNRPYPTHLGIRLHFTVGIGLKITDHVSVRYEHMSNGFGILNEMNVGLDNIGLEISF